MSSNEVQGEEKPHDEILFPAKPLPDIKNKIVRQEQYRKLKRQQSKEKKLEKRKKKNNPEAAGPKKIPKTIESLREPDDTTISALDDEENQEVLQDIVTSEYASFFNKLYEPKVLITCSTISHTKSLSFARDLRRMIPNSEYRLRKRFRIRQVIESCLREQYTDIVIIHENMRKPNGLMVIHLPEGPTVNFRLSNVKSIKELKHNHNHILDCRPEVILSNFTTRVGNRIASVLAGLFHYDPQFKGRRVVTFHNQRDYIFFRHHRYEFKKDGTKVALREHGPRFTLRPRWLQAGLFDGKSGEYEWMLEGRRKEMQTSRRRFFL